MITEEQAKKKLEELNEKWYQRDPNANNIVISVWIDAMRFILEITPEEADTINIGYN